jgi:hypothetical protein
MWCVIGFSGCKKGLVVGCCKYYNKPTGSSKDELPLTSQIRDFRTVLHTLISINIYK